MSEKYCGCQRPVMSLTEAWTSGAWVSNDICILPAAHDGDHWWSPGSTRPPIIVEDATE